MTQTPEERRLRRVASSYNRDAERLGQRYRVYWPELFTIESSSWTCKYCDIGLDVGQGTFDHAIPLDRGGPNISYNLVRCCYKCQREKGTKTPNEFAESRALEVACAICGKVFKPRWNEWQAGRGRLCSRRCAALKRWAS